MQVDITSPAQGTVLPAVQWNFEQLRVELTTALSSYTGTVYASGQLAQAKQDRSNLNKMRDALNDRKIEIKKLYLEPYEKFESEIKTLISLVTDCSSAIDAQVKSFEEYEKNEKTEAIRDIYNAWAKELAEMVPFESIFNKRWLNKGTKLAEIEEDLRTRFAKIRSAITAIGGVAGSDTDAVLAYYFSHEYDLAAALEEIKRLQRQREAVARMEAERSLQRSTIQHPTIVPSISHAASQTNANSSAVEISESVTIIDFRCWVTDAQKDALRTFLKMNNIKYGRVPQQ